MVRVFFKVPCGKHFASKEKEIKWKRNKPAVPICRGFFHSVVKLLAKSD